MMNRVKVGREMTVERELERVIEPLASYICATEQPGAALREALEVLLSEVDRTFKTASAHLASFSGSN